MFRARAFAFSDRHLDILGYFLVLLAPPHWNIHPARTGYYPTLYSRFTGFGLILIIVLGVGLWRVGIVGTLAYCVARILAEGLTMLVDRKAGTKFGITMGMEPAEAKAGAMYLAPARDFINAYKLYALKLGVPVDLEVSEDELQKENWIHVWDDLTMKWPEVASRFKAE